MYHRASWENVDSIQKEGLRANKSGYICLSFNPDSWWKELALFRVDIVGLSPSHLKVWPLEETDEMCIWIDVIPPERLTLLS
jgi:hypothetical protein